MTDTQKKFAAAIAAVMQVLQEEALAALQAAAMEAAPAAPAGPKLWALNGRQAQMQLRNLMQLNMLPSKDLSRTDRMRFLQAWRRQMRDLSPVEMKILASEAYRWALQRMRARGHT